MTQFNSSDKNLNQDSQSKEILAVGTSETWMSDDIEQKKQLKVSANEVTSLSALIAYVAYNLGENEYRIERRLSDRFNIPNVMCLPSGQFDSAIRYLVDGISQ